MTYNIQTGIYYRAYWHQPIQLSPSELVVRVRLGQWPANVVLLDDANFLKYLGGEHFQYDAGGFYDEANVAFTAPRAGRWHLVVDLAGQAGIPRATVEIATESPLSA